LGEACDEQSGVGANALRGDGLVGVLQGEAGRIDPSEKSGEPATSLENAGARFLSSANYAEFRTN